MPGSDRFQMNTPGIDHYREQSVDSSFNIGGSSTTLQVGESRDNRLGLAHQSTPRHLTIVPRTVLAPPDQQSRTLSQLWSGSPRCSESKRRSDSIAALSASADRGVTQYSTRSTIRPGTKSIPAVAVNASALVFRCSLRTIN